ncbi:MAG: hypothetical protein MUE83_00915 [Tabrizicola sp.]|nr:hypothetical protein [Tabrizicola sp.]
MTRSPILAILALAVLAAPGLACGNGECKPPQPPEKPPVVVEPPPSSEVPPVKPPLVVEPPPPPELPPVVVPPPPAGSPPELPPVSAPPTLAPSPGDRDPVAAGQAIHYGYCCQIDGRMHVSTAWLRNPVTALEQCRAREERLQSLPRCPRWVHRQEGGE